MEEDELFKVAAGIALASILLLVILVKGCGNDRPEENDTRDVVVETTCEVTRTENVTTISCPDGSLEDLEETIVDLTIELETLRTEIEEAQEKDRTIEERIEIISLDLEVLMAFKENSEAVDEALARENLIYEEELESVRRELETVAGKLNEARLDHFNILSRLLFIEDKLRTFATLEDIGKIYAGLADAVAALEAADVSLSAEVYAFAERIEALEDISREKNVTELIDLCGNAYRLGEIIVRLSDGTLVALYDSRKGERLSILKPGNYRTTDGFNCRFTVTVDGDIAY